MHILSVTASGSLWFYNSTQSLWVEYISTCTYLSSLVCTKCSKSVQLWQHLLRGLPFLDYLTDFSPCLGSGSRFGEILISFCRRYSHVDLDVCFGLLLLCRPGSSQVLQAFHNSFHVDKSPTSVNRKKEKKLQNKTLQPPLSHCEFGATLVICSKHNF